jgi:putative spermidine/putrescine transport system ATP-binding protein
MSSWPARCWRRHWLLKPTPPRPTRAGEFVHSCQNLSYSFGGGPAQGPRLKGVEEKTTASTTEREQSQGEPTPDAGGGAQTAVPPDIRLTGLAKRYGEVVAVDGIDLEISRGEFFTLLGPSGSGKTTTLRMIAGFEDPSAGSVELAGEDVNGVPPYDRAVNTVFQDYALFPHMSVGENVEYGLRVSHVDKAERASRRKEALEMVRLGDFADRRPNELSGGQRQRVALARAIVNRPMVLLLDEPLGALDLKLREQMQVELKGIQGEVGITFVYVTHDQDEALTMSDRIAVFNEGRIEQVSPPAELYEHPSNEFVAGFVGISNVLERGGRRFTIRPEKIRLLGPGEAAEGLQTEPGRIADVSYAGMITRFTVALEAGGKLQAVRQNAEQTSQDVESGRGQEIVVGWRPEHAVAIRGEMTKEEEDREKD